MSREVVEVVLLFTVTFIFGMTITYFGFKGWRK